MEENNKIGLALSGGGYRAAIYHIGTFRALKNMNLLSKIDVISSNSGGSITNGCYALYGENYSEFESKLLEGVKKGVIKRVIFSFQFLSLLAYIFLPVWNVVSPFLNTATWVNICILILMIFGLIWGQFIIFPLNRVLEQIYNRLFFDKKKLGDINNRWKTVINSTNLDTARLFTFEDSRMSDSIYTNKFADPRVEFTHDDFPIARAVVASTCVPFAFTPVTIAKQFYKNSDDYGKINPRLVDGGVYDNQGIHKVTQKNSSCYCSNVIVSDAGRGVFFEKKFRNQIALLIRTSDVFMERIKNLQMMNGLYREQDNNATVAYQSLSFDLNKSLPEFIKMLRDNHISQEVIDAHQIDLNDIRENNWEKIETYLSERIGLADIMDKGCSGEELSKIRKIETGLSWLKDWKIKLLIKHAEAITELQVKLFLPHILK
jgi:NTE family protein